MAEHNVLWEDLDLFKFMFWGAAGTASLEVIAHPADVVKTRLQIQRARVSPLHTFFSNHSTLFSAI